MKKTYKNLKEFKEAIDSGSVDGSKITITLDNDMTYYRYDDGSEDGKSIKIKSAGSGYQDYEELYELYFPDSSVCHC